ncbi:hypothetical protein ABZ613_13920 [Streptomyces collinus]
MLPGVEPQINSMVSVLGSAVRLSSMADAFHPLGGVDEPVGRSHVGLAQLLGGPALMPSLPGPAKMAGALAPQQFETESVQYVVGRFNEQEQAVLRVWAENHPMPWTKAPALVQQDEAQGEHNRRKLKRVAKEWHRHEINRRELP